MVTVGNINKEGYASFNLFLLSLNELYDKIAVSVNGGWWIWQEQHFQQLFLG